MVKEKLMERYDWQKIEQRSCPDRLGYAAVQINRVGWGAAFLQEHKIELDKKYEKFF